jgi:hypothetical protein
MVTVNVTVFSRRNVAYSGRNSRAFRRNMLPVSSELKNKGSMKHVESKHLMEAICSSETSVKYYQTARPYIPDNSTSHYRVHKCPPLGIILSQTNPINAFIPV